MVFESFLTLDYIKTFMGTVIVTMLVVQFFKGLPIVKKIPTKYFTFVVAFLNLIICSLLTSTFAIKNLYLMFINSMLVTFTSTGGYDFAIRDVKIDRGISPKVEEVKVLGIEDDEHRKSK